MVLKKKPGVFFMIPLILLFAGCASIPVDERAEVRAGIDSKAAVTLKRMMAADPGFREKLQSAEGSFVARLSTTKVPILGGGYGMGVLYERATGHKTYMNVTRAEFGIGLGLGQYRAVVLLEDQEVLEDFRNGFWRHGVGTESSVGTSSTGMQSSGKGYSIYFVSDAGAGIAASARSVRLSVNEDLTGNAISEFGIPNIGYKLADDPGDSAPRQWNRKLPIMAQKVIDEGYDLPLPFGFSVVYANVKQAMLLNDLHVGFNGDPQEAFEFVEFRDAEAHSESVQLKFDAWILPFMNIFALAGYVEGDAPMDVILDGNGMLDQMGHVCTGPLDPICLLLEDKTFTLPIVAPFSGNTYGIGTTLAGGWNDWFVALPFNATYADMNGTNTDGLALTATPRGGYVFNMGRGGNLALFAGGNYLYADLTVRGSVGVDDLFSIDYTVEQVNKDSWNVVTGFNWDLNRHLSWSAEYNGYVGSRDAFITSLTWRL